MSGKLDDLIITYIDAMRLFGMDDKSSERRSLPGVGEVRCCKLEPKYFICLHGMFIDVEQTEGIGLTAEERDGLLECSNGDPRQPCVEFPCTFEELKAFMEWEQAGELIDPFDMAEWVHRKCSSPVNGDTVEEGRPSHLVIIGALVKLLTDEAKNFNQKRIIEKLQNYNAKGLSFSNLEKTFSNANSELKNAGKE